MAARSSSSDVGPSAFEIKLGINTGRNSPDCDPETIVVSLWRAGGRLSSCKDGTNLRLNRQGCTGF
jgi:hypothetical protein